MDSLAWCLADGLLDVHSGARQIPKHGPCESDPDDIDLDHRDSCARWVDAAAYETGLGG